MDWQDNLPNVGLWQPNSGHRDNLSAGLLITCQAAQSRITAEAAIERMFNINNFDSGPGIEDIVRQELSKLLPNRYFVDCGVINDREGQSAGDCDAIIRDRIWSSVVKLGATPESRRYHFSIEGLYAVSEIKQTLGYRELDGAMEKLVKVSRLSRPDNPYGHITENQHLEFLDKPGQILNPLHTSIIGINLHSSTDFQDIALRFGKINSYLSRTDMVTALCVLNHGVAWYSLQDGDGPNATFMWDRDQHLQLSIRSNAPDNAFYEFVVHLEGHLHRSVLGTQHMASGHGQTLSPARKLDWCDARYNSNVQ